MESKVSNACPFKSFTSFSQHPDCPVCLEDVPDKRFMWTLSCGHQICIPCIGGIRNANRSTLLKDRCPICRTDFSDQQTEDEDEDDAAILICHEPVSGNPEDRHMNLLRLLDAFYTNFPRNPRLLTSRQRVEKKAIMLQMISAQRDGDMVDHRLYCPVCFRFISPHCLYLKYHMALECACQFILASSPY